MRNQSGQSVVKGNITLNVQVKHHWWGVPYLPVYLKKDALVWPGADSSKYEFQTTTDNLGNCVFNNLFPGNYYVYGHGMDIIFGMNVTGYGPVELKSSSGGEIQYSLYASE